MHKFFSFLIALFIVHPLFGQAKIDTALKHELDSLFEKDQSLRNILNSGLLQTKSDSLASSFGVSESELLNYIIKTMSITDSMNMVRVEQIIKQYGYPGRTLVGEETNEAAFFIIQHSKSIDKYLLLVKNAADNKELSFKLYAMMLDRSLMYNGKKQIYGTQGKGLSVLNKETGQTEFIMIIWPVKNPASVNTRRKKAGFKTTVEDYAKDKLGISYKAYTLSEIKKMEKPN